MKSRFTSGGHGSRLKEFLRALPRLVRKFHNADPPASATRVDIDLQHLEVLCRLAAATPTQGDASEWGWTTQPSVVHPK